MWVPAAAGAYTSRLLVDGNRLLTLSSLLLNSEMSDVINKIFVMQTKMNMRGGPIVGDICMCQLLLVALV